MFKKIRFYKALLIEIVETLCSICLYFESESRNKKTYCIQPWWFRSHFTDLKSFLGVMKGEYGKQDKDRVV